DEDVDVVAADLIGELLVGEGEGVAPAVGEGLEFARDVVGAGDAGVADDFEAGYVVVCEERAEEACGGVMAEIGGDVTDAKLAAGGAVVGVSLDACGEGSGVLVGPGPGFLVERLGGGGGGVVEREEEVVVGVGAGGIERESAAEE